MKASFLVFLLLTTGARAACLSGSLSIEDLNTAEMTHAEEAIQEFEGMMRAEVPPSHNLVITMEALNPRVNAEIQKNDKEVTINVMGGMLAHPKMNPSTLKLLLCHEMGHLLGGAPLKSRNGWSSTEGQADYYSTLACAKRMRFDEKTFINSALNLTAIYAEVSRESAPKLEMCDNRKVERTNYGYPPVQCRLDTLVAGWYEKIRPICWFKE